MHALAARALFAFAALCALAASTGVGVPPHRDEPGTPLLHDHVLAAYRFAFLLPAPEAEATLAPAMAKLHRTLLAAGVPPEILAQMPGMTTEGTRSALPTIKRGDLSPAQDLAIEFALLVIVVSRLPRPTLRAVAEIALPRVPASLWRLVPTFPPPRLALP